MFVNPVDPFESLIQVLSHRRDKITAKSTTGETAELHLLSAVGLKLFILEVSAVGL